MSGTADAGVSGVPSANAWSRPLQRNYNAVESNPLVPPPGMDSQIIESASELEIGFSIGIDHQSALRGRFLQLSLSMVGQRVVVTRSDGVIIEGVLHTFTPFPSHPPHVRNRYVLKSCKLVGGKEETFVDGSTVIIGTERVSSVLVKSMRLDKITNNGNPNPGTTGNQQDSSSGHGSDSFVTDSEIATSKDVRDHRLIAAGSAWISDGLLSQSHTRHDKLNGSPEESSSMGINVSSTMGGVMDQRSIGDWDQFKANEDLFDVRASFDENLYTTELDKSRINRLELRKAERLAKEIEATTSSNIHVSEERGHVVEGDYDEEDKYSGVLAHSATGNPLVPGNRPGDVSFLRPMNDESKGISSRKRNTGRKMNYVAAANIDSSAAKTLPPGFSLESRTGESGSLLTTDKGRARTKKDGNPSVPPSSVSQMDCDASNQPTPSLAAGEERKPLGDENIINEKVVDAVRDQTSTTIDSADQASCIRPSKLEKGEDSACGGSPEKRKSKLSASAKAFTFNPDAKAFTPGGGEGTVSSFHEPHSGEAAGVLSQQQIQSQQPPPYVQLPAQMAHAGLMPMVNARFATTMRFQGVHPPYQGMEQLSVQQIQSSQPRDRGVSNAQTEEPLSHQQMQGQASQQQHLPMSYAAAGPSAAYFGGGVALQRGPGAPHQGGYQQQLMGGPHQIPGAYHHRFASPGHVHQGGGIPTVAQMHVSGGNQPYFVARNVNYPSAAYGGHGPVEDAIEADHCGTKGNGPGIRKQVRKNERGGGHASYQSNYQNQDRGANGKPSPRNSLAPSAEEDAETGNDDGKGQS